ncbi:VapC toxin family PIN domain ribonuclease [Cryobacterium sp. PH31-L1]|uniref:VapC toxin family PIN domain ribonuclease n=1 Tax=Cryobacterium sp. PH31-L1 TaxID=3046199 RepID=UPI0024BBA7DF|nr:VapC toxin family PIN domain ribonuclease [Cryobacterium sp. PH31-L1]MDJ0377956.1 VapC toxin family PIN domain ribonuclease [Cryobacterium sp. PH31-L1]
MTTYLVDNSIWQKASRSPAIAQRLREISPHHLIMTCPPQVLEYCHSARSREEYVELREDMDELLAAWEHPTENDALNIQQALWSSGLMRAAVAIDVLIAAYAMVNDAVILNSDHDFGYLASATGGAVRQEYIAE